jgi:hypothetical protein
MYLQAKTLVERNVATIDCTKNCSCNSEFLMLIEEHALMSSNMQYLVAHYTCPLQRTNYGNSLSPSCKEKIKLGFSSLMFYI